MWKVKLQLSLYVTKHHTMNILWGEEVQLHAYLTSAVNGGEWSASRTGRFSRPRKETPDLLIYGAHLEMEYRILWLLGLQPNSRTYGVQKLRLYNK
jgi:hypothetical protein